MFQVPGLKCDLNFGLPVLAVLGIIHSIWVSGYLLEAIRVNFGFYDHSRDPHLIGAVKNTYYLLSLSTNVMLYYGFKNSDQKLVKYWYWSKLADYGFLVTGVILFAAVRFPRLFYWPYVLFGIVILGAGWCLVNTIQQGYHEIEGEVEPLSITNVFNNSKRQNQDSPPPYEAVENTQENLNPLAKSTLRFWGFLKILEFFVILPGIILIITNTQMDLTGNYRSYWNIFWFFAGLGFYFVLCWIFVWKMIPDKSLCKNFEQETEELLINSE